METLLQFIDIVNYFGDIETAKAFCMNICWIDTINDSKHAINACSETWNTYLK